MSLVLLLTLVSHAWAQNRTISGTVTDASNGEPLPGVAVIVKGTTSGTATSYDGTYSINIPENASTLVFRFIGYLATERPISSNVVNVALATDTKQLQEVVVTALGVEAEKRTLGYSAQNVKTEEIVQSREANVVNALAGKVAGVYINNSGGQAGSSSRIVIRGNTSLTGDNQPLFVIDGIPVDNSTNTGFSGESSLFTGVGGNRAIDIDPSLIESMTVLKGAAATALYGSRGGNGVIVITTKRGQKTGDRKFPRVNISSSIAFDDAIIKGFQDQYLQGTNKQFASGTSSGPESFSEVRNASGVVNYFPTTSWGPHKDSVSQAVLDAVGKPSIYNPREQFYRTGRVLTNSISVSGGGDKSTYLLSFSNLDQEGIVPNNKFKRNNVAANFTSQLTEKFNVNTSVSYINSDHRRLPEGNGARSYLYGLNFTPISFDIDRFNSTPGNPNINYSPSFNNPFWLAANNGIVSQVDRFIVSTSADYQVLPWLKVSNRVGLDTYTDENGEETSIGTAGALRGRMYESLIKRHQLNNDFIVSANYDINEDLHVTGLVGHNVNVRKYSNRTVRGLNLALPGYFDITSAEKTEAYQADSERRLVGLYANATLEYKGYLFLNLSGRNDWSSTLPIENNSFFYPSASVGFVFTDVIGLSNSPYFSYGKVRASIAQAGNDASPYLTNRSYTQANPGDGTRGNINFPFDGQNGFDMNGQLWNSNLVHELVTEQEVGADLRFFQDRLGLDLAYYNKVSKNQILSQEISATSGFTNRVINAGKIVNKGAEATLTATPVKINDFNWDIQVNFSKNNYELKEIAEGVDNIFLGGFTSPQIRADKTYGYGVIWGSRFARNDNGEMIIGANGRPKLADDLGPIGNVTPDWTGGIRNTLSYKGLSLSALLDIRQGGDILNMDLYYSSFYGTAKVTENRGQSIVFDGVKEDGTKNDIPVVQSQSYFQNYYSNIDEFFVEDGSFIKLRELSLKYTLPQSLISKTPFEAVSLSATGRNLWIKSDFSYGDPEGSLLGNGNAQGFYHAVTPSTKGYTFGVNVAF